MTRSQRSTQMTVAEIVDETVQFYNEDVSRRAVKSVTGLCVYTDEHGKHCAIGRCLIDGNFNYGGGVKAIWGTEDKHDDGISVELDKALKEQYRGHTLGFWSNLQTLHDSESSWDTHGITQRGRDRADKIKCDHV